MSKQRQLAAIVFTDISDFTSLMDRDESEALKIRHKQRDSIQNILKEFNGEYIKEIGDGDLMMFNSATDAVKFTLKLQSDINPKDNYTIRAAIHLGDVVREDNDIFGAGVNMASRIHSFASPGCTVISDSVFKEIKNKSNFFINSIGEKNVKGIDEPIHMYQVSLAADKSDKKYIEKSIIKDLFDRRVPQFIGLYFAVSWGIIQFISWSVDRYLLSPHLVDLSLSIAGSMIPSILILSYFHGRPGKDKWNRIEKIIVPANFIIASIVLFVSFYPKNLGAITKEVTLEDVTGNKITKIIIQSEFRKSYVMFNFKNNSSNSSSDWMGEGIRRVLIADLSQDTYLSQRSGRARDMIQEMGFNLNEDIPLTVKQKISKRTTTEFFIAGDYIVEDELFVINVQLYRTNNAKLISNHQYKGKVFFDLIDLASKQIRIDMGIPSSHIEEVTDIPVTEKYTNSLEALKYKVLSKRDELTFDEKFNFLLQAVELDNSFAWAHMELYSMCRMKQDPGCYAKHINLCLKHIDRFDSGIDFAVRIDELMGRGGTVEERNDILDMWVEIHSDQLMPYGVLAQFSMMDNNFDEAILYTKKMLKIAPEKENLILEIGRMYQDYLNDTGEALIYYNQYKNLYPENPESYESIASVYRKRLDFKNEYKYLIKAQALGATGPTFEIDLINVSSKLNNWAVDKYIDEIYPLLEKYPPISNYGNPAFDSKVAIYNEISNKLESRGLYKRSIKYHRELADYMGSKMGPVFSGIFALGVIEAQVKLGNASGAAEYLQEVTSLLVMPPMSYFAPFMEICVYAETKDWDNFNATVNEAIEGINNLGFSGMMPLIFAFQAEYFESIGEIESAIDLYKNASTSSSMMGEDDTSKDAYMQLARIYQELDNFKESEKMFAIFFKMEHESAEGFYEYSILKEKQGESDDAREFIIKAYNLYHNADSELELAQKIFDRYNHYQNQLPLP